MMGYENLLLKEIHAREMKISACYSFMVFLVLSFAVLIAFEVKPLSERYKVEVFKEVVKETPIYVVKPEFTVVEKPVYIDRPVYKVIEKPRYVPKPYKPKTVKADTVKTERFRPDIDDCPKGYYKSTPSTCLSKGHPKKIIFL
ncbi:MAG: hypothetical protein ABL933_15810 [Methyloglobulus sp.]